MNVASLELSKELYELSGWKGTHAVWYWYEDYDCIDDSYDKATCRQSMDDKKSICPAYDLGYLLRKLPININLGNYFEGFTLDVYVGQWSCRYGLKAPARIEGRAGTPEDAAAKLAIELFKQGILKKEDRS